MLRPCDRAAKVVAGYRIGSGDVVRDVLAVRRLPPENLAGSVQERAVGIAVVLQGRPHANRGITASKSLGTVRYSGAMCFRKYESRSGIRSVPRVKIGKPIGGGVGFVG